MLSYKHGFHAGNQADVLKHICLIQTYKSLKKHYKSISYIDTHAGSGIYEFNNDQILIARSLIKSSDINFVPGTIKTNQFNDTVESLTIFVENKTEDGVYENILVIGTDIISE